jgi:hypothetical protein
VAAVLLEHVDVGEVVVHGIDIDPPRVVVELVAAG